MSDEPLEVRPLHAWPLAGAGPLTHEDYGVLASWARSQPIDFEKATGLLSHSRLSVCENPTYVAGATLLAAGLPIAACMPYSKIPMGSFKSQGGVARIISTADLEQRLEFEPNLNLALVIGVGRTKGLVVVDPDVPDVNARLADLRVGWTQARRGNHIPLHWTGPGNPTTRKGAGRFAGCDLKADGLVMLSPSRVIQTHRSVHDSEHVTYHQYTEDPEWSQTGYTLEWLPGTPDDLVALMSTPAPPERPRRAHPAAPAPGPSRGPVGMARRAQWLDVKNDGQRFRALMSVVVQSQAWGMGAKEVFVEIMAAPLGSKLRDQGPHAWRWFMRRWEKGKAFREATSTAPPSKTSRPRERALVDRWLARVLCDRSLRRDDRKILRAHARHMQRHGLHSYMATSMAAKATGLSNSQVHRARRRLIVLGHLLDRGVTHPSGRGRHQAHYWSPAYQGVAIGLPGTAPPLGGGHVRYDLGSPTSVSVHSKGAVLGTQRTRLALNEIATTHVQSGWGLTPSIRGPPIAEVPPDRRRAHS